MRSLYNTNVELAKQIEIEQISREIERAVVGDANTYPATSIFVEIQYPDTISALQQSGYRVLNGYGESQSYKISW